MSFVPPRRIALRETVQALQRTLVTNRFCSKSAIIVEITPAKALLDKSDIFAGSRAARVARGVREG
jgi:hypothetical protein